MTAILDHTIVPVSDRHRGARFLAGLLDVQEAPPAGHFVPVRINDELTFDFDDRFGAQPSHYAFRVDGALFDRAVAMATGSDLAWGSAPRQVDRRVGEREGGRVVYIRDPDGVAYELITASQPPAVPVSGRSAILG
ncbi:MAG TPA: VOC family protein [Candidatus Dormibacteraeota bacterium]|jgi:hypothetical protein|nr:VOC family protein [Candidatus Dormibacteraeota bacterium]